MNKKSMLMILLMPMLLAACGTDRSWENQPVTVASHRLMADMVEAKWSIKGAPAGTGGTKQIRLEIRNKDGKPVEAFDINHEKLLHLIVISKDLSYFNHIHPEYKGGGVFEIENNFPAGGEYRFIADFKPAGGDSMTKMEWIQIEGPTAAKAPLIKETTLADVTGGKKVELAIEGLGVNRETALTFSVMDEATNQPIADLEPYLGAIGHVVLLSEDGERYVHVHAEEDQGTGPQAKFETSFPQSGLYKLWAQFQRSGQVFTVSYTINVP